MRRRRAPSCAPSRSCWPRPMCARATWAAKPCARSSAIRLRSSSSRRERWARAHAMNDDVILGEESIIQEFLAPLAAGFPGAFGLKDDCAVLAPPPGCELVVKTDPVIAGVHFLTDTDAADIAWKALAVNVSDLAAKGATPLAYVMSIALPRLDREWLANFRTGLAA